MINQMRAQALHQGQFQRLLKITRATSRYADRDVLAIMLGHHCGMRVTEISRITIADVMHPSGKLRAEISLREAVTKGCRQRCCYLVTAPLVSAMESYLRYRIERGVGTELAPGPYRGLLPHQPLIFSSRGTGMSQNTKRRTLETGEERAYKACDSLLMRTCILTESVFKTKTGCLASEARQLSSVVKSRTRRAVHRLVLWTGELSTLA